MHTMWKFSAKKMYIDMPVDEPKVPWNILFYYNKARPRAQMLLWLVCNAKVATKSRLHKLGMIDNAQCCFCAKEETLNHLIFGCAKMRKIWHKVLLWTHIQHDPLEQDDVIKWIMLHGKDKGWRATIVKLALTETLYEL